MQQAYVFQANLAGFRGVTREVAVRSDQTLEDLHLVLQTAFEWADDHLYSFWLTGTFWDSEAEYTSPIEPDAGADTADTAIVGELGLETGQKLAYLFDFGDEWRVQLTVSRIEPADGGDYPRIVASKGQAPPQYEYDEELARRE